MLTILIIKFDTISLRIKNLSFILTKDSAVTVSSVCSGKDAHGWLEEETIKK